MGTAPERTHRRKGWDRTRHKVIAQIRPLDTVGRALIVRRLRNSGCEYFTNHNKRIGVAGQIYWYLLCYRRQRQSGGYRVFLFYSATGAPAAYGALQLREGKLWVTECVAPGYRGQGVGAFVLQHLMSVARSERRGLAAEILATNQASVALHRKMGFVRISTLLRQGRSVEVYEAPD